MLLGQRPVGADELQAGEAQALALEALDDRADQPALHAVRFEEEESLLHDASRSDGRGAVPFNVRPARPVVHPAPREAS